MDFYCDVCDKTFEYKSKSKHLQSLTHEDFEKCIPINHTVENLEFFDVDEIFDKNITNHNKNFYLYFIKYNFTTLFDEEFYPDIQSELRINQSKFHLKEIFFFTSDSVFY